MKRIVICADGTWCDRDLVDPHTGRRRPTNVTKVARAIAPQAPDGTNQVVFYHDGIGMRGGIDRFTGGAFGDGMERNIRDLYRFIVYTYVPGDELYLFGFSRGAFTVRSLAGFMHRVGLIEKDDDYYVPDLYDCYEQRQGPGTALWERTFRRIRDPRPCPAIRLIGVWETVGALGAPGFLGQWFNRDGHRYHDVGLSAAIQNAYHALAIDERRKPFAPNLWTRPPGWAGTLQQAWFPGEHGNVGGGLTPDGMANEALHWIVEKAEGLGLTFDDAYLEHFVPCYNSRLNDPVTLAFRLLGIRARTLGAHIADGEAVHECAIDRMDDPECDYHPANLEAWYQEPGGVPVVTTTRIFRQRPCRELPQEMPAARAA